VGDFDRERQAFSGVEPSRIRLGMDELMNTAAPPEIAPTVPVSGLLRDVTSGKVLVRNTGWNFAGIILPSIAALASIPVLTRKLGTDQFGILTLCWIVIGQLNLFDLGLGRALTKLVAERLGTKDEYLVPPMFWSSFLLTLALGLFAGLVVALVTPWAVYHVLKVPEALRPETVKAFYAVALAMPSVVNTISLRGFLEGCHRFDLLNAVRVPSSVAFYAGPLMVVLFSRRLVPVMIVLLVARYMGWLAHLWACLRAFPALSKDVSPRNAPLRQMFTFGSWMTVSNIAAPILVSLDRFFIATVLSVTAVAYYATPNEMVAKVLVLPGAMVSVLFPVFSASLTQAPERAPVLFERGMKCLLAMIFPVILVIVGFGHELLFYWLGPAFAANSTRVLQWLGLGAFFNSLAFIPFVQLQGAGRPDVTAKLHVLELPVYLVVLWGLLHWYGIMGAALAWFFRAALDCGLLLFSNFRILPACQVALRRTVNLSIVSAGLLAVPIFLPGLWLRIAYVAGVALVSAAFAWSRMLTPGEKAFVYTWFGARDFAQAARSES
jgi:O-antigen/teichoic acid export membrane protein